VAAITDYALLDAAAIGARVDASSALRARLGEIAAVEEVDDEHDLVFRVRGRHGSLLVKQALPYLRHYPEWALTPERASRAALLYERYAPFGAGLVPELVAYDAPRFTAWLAGPLEGPSWRHALCDGQACAPAAAAMGALVARAAFHGSALTLPRAELAERLHEARNPELTQLMDDLVFVEPYDEHEHNSYAPQLAPAVQSLRADARLRAEVGRLRHRYATAHEALLHGDLHAGNVVLGGDSALACNGEFSTYGPVAWDLGMLLASALLALVSEEAHGASEERLDDLGALAGTAFDAFEQTLRALWPARRDTAFGDGFLDAWLQRTLRDALGFAGCELLRRVVGPGALEELDRLDPPQRLRACRSALAVARTWLLYDASLGHPAPAVRAARRALAEAGAA
jgi:5-methylthioribose kinase